MVLAKNQSALISFDLLLPCFCFSLGRRSFQGSTWWTSTSPPPSGMKVLYLVDSLVTRSRRGSTEAVVRWCLFGVGALCRGGSGTPKGKQPIWQLWRTTFVGNHGRLTELDKLHPLFDGSFKQNRAAVRTACSRDIICSIQLNAQPAPVAAVASSVLLDKVCAELCTGWRGTCCRSQTISGFTPAGVRRSWQRLALQRSCVGRKPG